MKSDKIKSKRPPRIWVTDEITRTLANEFETSNVTVLNALKFISYSDQAQSIRTRAMELMKETEKQNKKLMDEFQG